MKTTWKLAILGLMIIELLYLSRPASLQAQGDPSPTPTETPATACDPPDPFEPNETAGSGPALILGQPLGDLLLTPLGDVDFFLLWGKAGETYRLTTASGDGLDTRLRVYDGAGVLLAENDDYVPGDPGSQVTLQVGTEGWYSVSVDSSPPLDWACRRYNIQAEELAPTPTPTVTPTGTPASATAVPEPRAPDAYEPNNDISQAVTTGVGLPINLNFNPFPLDSQAPDQDWFRFAVKPGDWLRIETINLAAGLDTSLTVYGQNGEIIGSNDDCGPARRSCLEWRPGYNGIAYVQIIPIGLLPDPVTAGARAYNLAIIDLNLVTPTATPTKPPKTPDPTQPPPSATAQPTPVPAERMPDPYEPNYEPARASSIGQGQTLNTNFVPWPPGAAGIVDNDFFKFSVKQGDRLRIETLNLAPGVDTNIILYRENQQVIGGNDDCTEAERRSCLEWVADYSGIVYLLVGPVGLVPDPTTPGASAYSLAIVNLDMVTPTPAAGSPGYGQAVPWPVTPVPPTETATATPSATPTVAVMVRPFSMAPPTATPKPLQSVTLDVTIYYDANNNQAPDVEEGVVGVDVRALDSVNNQILGQAFTDSYGHATLTVATTREVRLSVPYLGYNQAVRPPGKELVIRLAALQLPSLIP